MDELLTRHGIEKREKRGLLSELPRAWERHGDLVVLPRHAFAGRTWSTLGPALWTEVATAMGCARLARDERVACDEVRSSRAVILLGRDGWTEHVDNGVKYVFDVTKCIFSSGNVTEKLRVATFDCTDETVVDLYAGIGYFTLPYLVHARACFVHAWEWNRHAVEALHRGLKANGVTERCTVHSGDNRRAVSLLRGRADRVNLGLIPSSERGWPVACALLNPESGGWLHIHGNVTSKPDKQAGSSGSRTNPWERREDEETAVASSPLTGNVCCDNVTVAEERDSSTCSSKVCQGRETWRRSNGEACRNKSTVSEETDPHATCSFTSGAEVHQRREENWRLLTGEACGDSVTVSEETDLPASGTEVYPRREEMQTQSNGDACSSELTLSEPETDRSARGAKERLRREEARTGEAHSDNTTVSERETDPPTTSTSGAKVCPRREFEQTSRQSTGDACSNKLHVTVSEEKDPHASSPHGTKVRRRREGAWQQWTEFVVERIGRLLAEGHSGEEGRVREWAVQVGPVVHVKSYAPHIDHLVLDVECRPMHICPEAVPCPEAV